jgi:hypothetical protein
MDKFKMFEIVPAGQPLLDLVTKTFSGFDEVTEVRFTAFDLPDGNLAAFLPLSGTVVVDMGNAAIAKSNYWMEQGATYIASTWFNLVFGIFHERAHVRQVRENAELKGLDHATEIMEAAANAEANSALLAWAEDNPAIPGLDDLGFAGEYIKEVLNAKYSEYPQPVLRELNCQGTNTVAIFSNNGQLGHLQTKEFLHSVICTCTSQDQSEVFQDRIDGEEEPEEVLMVTSA